MSCYTEIFENLHWSKVLSNFSTIRPLHPPEPPPQSEPLTHGKAGNSITNTFLNCRSRLSRNQRVVQRWCSADKKKFTPRAEQKHRKEPDPFYGRWYGFYDYHSCTHLRRTNERRDRRRKRAELGEIPLVCPI